MNKYLKLCNPEGEKEVVLKDNESLEIFLEDVASGSRRFFLKVVLVGRGAKCFIRGRISTSQKDEKEWNITQWAEGDKQQASIELRGASENEGVLKFNTKGIIGPQSKDADVRVINHIWIFDKGRGYALPILDVHTNVIKSVHHSAIVAPIAEEKILYLISKGIAREKAEKILKTGFLRF